MSGYLSQNVNRISSKIILNSTVCQNLKSSFNIILIVQGQLMGSKYLVENVRFSTTRYALILKIQKIGQI